MSATSAIVSAAVMTKTPPKIRCRDRLISVEIEARKSLAGLPSSFVTVASAPFVSGIVRLAKIEAQARDTPPYPRK